MARYAAGWCYSQRGARYQAGAWAALVAGDAREAHVAPGSWERVVEPRIPTAGAVAGAAGAAGLVPWRMARSALRTRREQSGAWYERGPRSVDMAVTAGDISVAAGAWKRVCEVGAPAVGAVTSSAIAAGFVTRCVAYRTLGRSRGAVVAFQAEHHGRRRPIVRGIDICVHNADVTGGTALVLVSLVRERGVSEDQVRRKSMTATAAAGGYLAGDCQRRVGPSREVHPDFAKREQLCLYVWYDAWGDVAVLALGRRVRRSLPTGVVGIHLVTGVAERAAAGVMGCHKGCDDKHGEYRRDHDKHHPATAQTFALGRLRLFGLRLGFVHEASLLTDSASNPHSYHIHHSDKGWGAQAATSPFR
jgi:hypothetical protein